jgi:ABC-type nitrate/sulfonate/bicarbonate transport system substrate-binding protein
MLDALVQGKLECAITPFAALLKKVETTADSLVILASGEYRTSIPIDAIVTMANASTKIKDLKDLKNKRFGYPIQIKEVIPVILKSIGLKETELKLFEMSNSDLVQALRDNKIDAALVLEPERTAAINQGMSLVMEPVLPKLIIAPYPGVAYVIKKDLIKNNPRISYKIKMLLDATVAFADANTEESRAMFINFFKLDKDVYGNIFMPQFQKMIEVNKSNVITMMTKMNDAGVLSQTFDIQKLFVEPSQFKK